jgi:hypothetical protein
LKKVNKMDEQKFKIVIDRLIKLSEIKELNWKTTGNPDTYLLVLKDSSISISSLYSEDIREAIEIQFRNEKGEIVETVLITNDNSLSEKANHLFSLARGKALNSDNLIDRILEQLKLDNAVIDGGHI